MGANTNRGANLAAVTKLGLALDSAPASPSAPGRAIPGPPARRAANAHRAFGRATPSLSTPGQTVVACPPKRMASALLSYASVGRYCN